MKKFESFLKLLVPSATVFVSSACIMILELVAGRLISRYLGSSLYTWTSVIGVVLAGITIGNYIGGRIADRFQPKKTLAVLLGISSVACISVVIMNNIVANLKILIIFSWPAHVFTHVTAVFLVPSILLGTISPVVAKMALDKGLATGRTIGCIYAWGAAGSILGTFLAGFYLIATMGTIAIIWLLGGILLLMAILYWIRQSLFYLWMLMFLVLLALGKGPWQWTQQTGAAICLREKHNPNIIYEDETNYSYVAVKTVPGSPGKRVFKQDALRHSVIIMNDIKNLQYDYAHVYAAVTHMLSDEKNKLSVLVIGGGGYVFPRYIQKLWPESHIDVAEIDKGVTKAAMKAFGLKTDTSINTITMDARNYVDQLTNKQNNGKKNPLYDFIYGDAFNDYSVPYQLVTKEFNDKLDAILKDDGIYMLNLVDIFDSGLLLGAFVNTLEQTFPYIYIVAKEQSYINRSTFVVIGAKQDINIENLGKQSAVKNLNLWILTDSDIKELKEKAKGISLSDDYAPVENLLAPVLRDKASHILHLEYLKIAKELKAAGEFEEYIALYEEMAGTIPKKYLDAYKQIAYIRKRQGKLEMAIEALTKAVEHNQHAKYKINLADVHLKLGLLLKQKNHTDQAKKHFLKARDGAQKLLEVNPNSFIAIKVMGVTLIQLGQLDDAAKYLKLAIDIDPHNLQDHFMLGKALAEQERYDEAITALKNAQKIMSRAGNKQAVVELQKSLNKIKKIKSGKTKPNK